MADQKLGIDNLKMVVGLGLDLSLQLADDLKDKHLSTGEAVGLAFKIPSVIKAVNKLKDAIEEVKDIDPDEAKELLQFIADKLNVKPE